MTKRFRQAAGAAVLYIALIATPSGAQTGVASDGSEASPAIDARSSLDWENRTLRSDIWLDARKSNLQLPTGRNAALQMIEMETPSLLKDTYSSIIVNSSQRLGKAIESGEVSLDDLNRLIDDGKKTPPYFTGNMTRVSMTHTVSIAQIGSLFVRHRSTSMPKPPLERIATRPYSGIIIDARGDLPVHGEYVSAPLVPCLFPRIWSPDMNIVYEKNMVNPEAARAQGIVRYSASLDESAYRDRVGDDPLRITARAVFGLNRTDPVISADDSLRIMTLAENRQLLDDGKVIIICNPDQLRIRPTGPESDDGYYFVRRELEDAIRRKAAGAASLSDSTEGLKLTLYDVRFEADTANILPEERERLDVIAEALAQSGRGATFTIAGHTASVGNPSGEQTLSELRARVIASELAARGISAERFETAGYGGTVPLASNDTGEGRARNRRVEITVKLPETASN